MPVDDKSHCKHWELYLAQTRNLSRERYEQVEPLAWAQLQARLGNLQVKRKAVA